MKTELRVSNYENLESYLMTNVDIIGLGDEYCEWSIFNLKNIEKTVNKILSAGKAVRIVTAFTTKELFEKTANLIKDMYKLSETIEFVINDYGLLSYLKESGVTERIIIGQMLNHSLEEYLWSDEVVENEIDKVKESWLMSNFGNKTVIQYFKDYYNIKGCIFNLLPYGRKSAEVFMQKNLEVNFSDKYYTMAVARKCHQAKYYSIMPSENCQSCCKKRFSASLEKTYAIHEMDEKYVVPKKEILDKVQNWTIYGNVIYHEYQEDFSGYLGTFSNTGVMILQDRFYDNLEQVNNKIEMYKEV